MVRRLNIDNKDIVLEPSAGEGVFIDGMLNRKPAHIDALDIDKNAISILKDKYRSRDFITIKKTDTLLDSTLDHYAAIGGYYDKIIGNPPYGAWQEYEKRDLLKKKYTGQYVRETYSLFLLRCISLLKIGGRLSFIIPDTYMFLNLHSKLRNLLLSSTKINEIIIFPSKFFPGVSFGYSNLSIITLEKADRTSSLNNTVKIVKGFQSSSEFELLIGNKELPDHLNEFYLNQKDIYDNAQHRFIIADNQVKESIVSTSSMRLGDVADVVTGFYTGDNKRFIRALDDSVKNSKQYKKIDPSLIYPCTSLSGIENVNEGYVPYIKSASSTRYCRPNNEWFVRWDKDTILHYNNDKKARFQNSKFYFKTGITVPMVKSSTIRACLMSGCVFDQSIVGIFPKNEAKLYYLLALMNSNVANELIHTINPTANNSANYIKQIPYIEPGEDLFNEITSKTKKIIDLINTGSYNKCEKIHQEIDDHFRNIYAIN